MSLAEVKAALVPLAEMPTGTRAITLVAAKGEKTCTPREPPVTPVVRAHATYVQHVGPKTENGFRTRTFDETVSVFAKGTSAQRMNDLRALPRCSGWSAAALSFPRIASDQVTLRLAISLPPFRPSHADFIALRVNDSAVVVFSSLGEQTMKATEVFAREAYSRARSKLGG